jgi:hypothetical protein
MATKTARNRTIDSSEIGAGGDIQSKPPRRLPLRTVTHCRNEMARVYRRVDSGDLEAQEGTRRCYILGELVKVIKDTDLESSLLALEAQETIEHKGIEYAEYYEDEN